MNKIPRRRATGQSRHQSRHHQGVELRRFLHRVGKVGDRRSGSMRCNRHRFVLSCPSSHAIYQRIDPRAGCANSSVLLIGENGLPIIPGIGIGGCAFGHMSELSHASSPSDHPGGATLGEVNQQSRFSSLTFLAAVTHRQVVSAGLRHEQDYRSDSLPVHLLLNFGPAGNSRPRGAFPFLVSIMP